MIAIIFIFLIRFFLIPFHLIFQWKSFTKEFFEKCKTENKLETINFLVKVRDVLFSRIKKIKKNKKNKKKRNPTGVIFSSLLLRNGLFKTWQENTHGASPTRRKSALNPLVLSPSPLAVLYHPSFAVL